MILLGAKRRRQQMLHSSSIAPLSNCLLMIIIMLLDERSCPINLHVCRLVVGWLVGVCHNFIRCGKYTFDRPTDRLTGGRTDRHICYCFISALRLWNTSKIVSNSLTNQSHLHISCLQILKILFVYIQGIQNNCVFPLKCSIL